MKVASKAQMNTLDKEAIEKYNIPSILLMEQAAYQVFNYMKQLTYKQVVIVCGMGNNAGDGLALARQLAVWGDKNVHIVMMQDAAKLSEDASSYYNIVEKMDIPLTYYQSSSAKAVLEQADVIVDALFGTGLSRHIEGDYEEVITFINSLPHAYRISIDIPSGIACDTGKVLGVAVKADVTITFEMLKLGLCLYPGVMYAGNIHVVPIGIPQALKMASEGVAEAIDFNVWQSYLPPRPFRSNKGTFGKVLIIGGSKSMAGSITLTAKSCMKVGAGLVTVAVPESIYPLVEGAVLEAMTIGCPTYEGQFAEDTVAWLKEKIHDYDTILIGPGMGRTKVTESLIEVVLTSDKPCVIDADGLYGLKPHLSLLKERKVPTILTPHPGEFSFLIDQSIKTILEDPLTFAKVFATLYPVTLVLKLERTLVVNQREVLINTTGNTGLAKGGSGDVLTGMIGGFLAQQKDDLKAACLGVYGHGKLADLCVVEKSAYSLLPSDMIGCVEKLFIY